MRRVAGDGSTGGRDDGDGPAVLLVRGFADSSALWLHRLPALTAAGLRAVAPDLHADRLDVRRIVAACSSMRKR